MTAPRSYRRQAALQHQTVERTTSPLRDSMRLLRARVINVDRAQGRVDVALPRGGVLRRLPLLTGGGSKAGSWELPQIWNSPALIPEGRVYDEAGLTTAVDPTRNDVFAIVGFADGLSGQPVVLGMLSSDAAQLSMEEQNLKLERTIHDIVTQIYSDQPRDLRPPPLGDGPADPTDPTTQLRATWQLVFPDRYKDYPVGRKQVIHGDDYQTYLSVGYYDVPRVWGDGKTSANFDSDWTPWQLSPAQKGDETKKQRDHARGITLNQRWRSRLQIDPHGNVLLRAEGRSFDSTHFHDTEVSEGRMDLWARLEQRQWSKHHFQWVRMRPRHDGGDPESVREAKRTGDAMLRVQHDWDVAVRRQIRHTSRESYALTVGDFPTHWSDGPGGQDPGTLWDPEVLNPDFRASVDKDEIWHGTKEDGYAQAANGTFSFVRPQKSEADPPQTLTFLLQNKQLPTDKRPQSDAVWTEQIAPTYGAATFQQTLAPAVQGAANWTVSLAAKQQPATWQATASSDMRSAMATLKSVTGSLVQDAVVQLVAQGKYTVTLVLDALAGQVQITAPNGVIINGIPLAVP